MLARLRHPNLVRVFDLSFDEVCGTPFFVMDLVLDKDGKGADEADIPDSVKSMSVFELEGTLLLVKNMLCNMGVCTLWELTHFDMENSAVLKGFSASSQRIVELEYAIKEAVDILKGSS